MRDALEILFERGEMPEGLNTFQGQQKEPHQKSENAFAFVHRKNSSAANPRRGSRIS
jgi:hypothetical protein